MCIQFYREYMCGCKKDEEFCQCTSRYGSNVACAEVDRQEIYKANNMCLDHLVTAGSGQKEIRISTWNMERSNGDLDHSKVVTAFKGKMDQEILAKTWDVAEFVRRNAGFEDDEQVEKEEEEKIGPSIVPASLRMTARESEDMRKVINKECAENVINGTYGRKKSKKKGGNKKKEDTLKIIFPSRTIAPQPDTPLLKVRSLSEQ